MASFRERIGAKTPRFEPQLTDLDAPTRNSLWNVIYVALNEEPGTLRFDADELRYELFEEFWSKVFERRLDQFYPDRTVQAIQESILRDDATFALETFDEFIVRYSKLYFEPTDLIDSANECLSRYLVGYRFIAGELAPITDTHEVEEVNRAASSDRVVAEARQHLGRAITLLSDREKPNYSKAAAEALDAVEAQCFALTREKTLTKALGKLRRRGARFHPVLIASWERLYDWASDAGVRHANHRGEEIGQPLATYVVVTCSALLNYLDSEDLTLVENSGQTT